MMTLRLRAVVHGTGRGFTLIEVLVALAILGLVGVGIMSGLRTGLRAQDHNRVEVVGENLARAVLEDIRFEPYLDSYASSTADVPVPSGYSFSVTTEPYCDTGPPPCEPYNNDLQKTTVAVSRGVQGVITVEDLKVRRVP